jgi:hypothetical protein
MAATDVQQPPAQEPAPALPDYLADPDAILKDTDVTWRYGRAPDYSKTRKVFAESTYLSFLSLAQSTHPLQQNA